MKPSPTVLVLGASGRIGSRIVDSLRDRQQPVIAASRSLGIKSEQAVRVDTRNSDELRALFASIKEDFYVVNCVLDSSSAHALVNTIVQTADSISRVVPENCLGIISISSTAILSSALLRTDYANAKIREIELLVNSGKPVHALVCPIVVSTGSEQKEIVVLDRYVINADSVARIITDLVAGLTSSKPSNTLVIPSFSDLNFKKATDRNSRLYYMVQYIRLSLRQLWDPKRAHHYQRSRTYALLRVMPKKMRLANDHHLLPSSRITQISKRLNLEVVDINRRKRHA